MHLSIRGRRLDVSEPLRAYAERRLQFAVGEFQQRISEVDVRVSDVNGPRGGIDKACDIAVELRPFGRLFARAVEVNAYAAVDRAASRARSVLVRRLGQLAGRAAQRTIRGSRSAADG